MRICTFTFAVATAFVALTSCGDNTTESAELLAIEPAMQRPGDAKRGWDYLVYGDYVSSGIPLDVYVTAFGEQPNLLNRTGASAKVGYTYNAIKRGEVTLAAPQCLTCHAQPLMGKLVVGLGNALGDYTGPATSEVRLADGFVTQRYGQNSPEYRAFLPFLQGTRAIAEDVVTETRGVNPADKIFALLAAHRDAQTLVWSETPYVRVPVEVVVSDVPPWWHIRKKHALYYNGIGRGDFARLSSAADLLTLADANEAAAVDAKMPDVMQWMRELRAPAYPFAIDAARAATGQTIFEANCARCHGTYGATESYPNLFVPIEMVGTDPRLYESYFETPFVDWYNRSWYARDARFAPAAGYMAPPLDGIWATAPYFHNGSVPTLEGVLNSTGRPTYWKRSFGTAAEDYDQVQVGWRYTAPSSKVDFETYDTTLKGYGNPGHTFADALTAAERAALIEYLKTI